MRLVSHVDTLQNRLDNCLGALAVREVPDTFEQVPTRLAFEVRTPALVAGLRLHDPVVRANQEGGGHCNLRSNGEPGLEVGVAGIIDGIGVPTVPVGAQDNLYKVGVVEGGSRLLKRLVVKVPCR